MLTPLTQFLVRAASRSVNGSEAEIWRHRRGAVNIFGLRIAVAGSRAASVVSGHPRNQPLLRSLEPPRVRQRSPAPLERRSDPLSAGMLGWMVAVRDRPQQALLQPRQLALQRHRVEGLELAAQPLLGRFTDLGGSQHPLIRRVCGASYTRRTRAPRRVLEISFCEG